MNIKRIIFPLFAFLVLCSLSFSACADETSPITIFPESESKISILSPFATISFSEEMKKDTIVSANFSSNVQNIVYNETDNTAKIYFKPNYVYCGSEIVLTLSENIKTKSGKPISPNEFEFEISSEPIESENLIANGDFENTDWIPFFLSGNGDESDGAVYTIEKDPKNDKNHVLQASPSKDVVKTWLYTRQFLNLTPGTTYKLEFDARYVKDQGGSPKSASSLLYFSSIYENGSDVSMDLVGNSELTLDGNWEHLWVILNVPDEISDKKQLQFAVYANPILDEYGVTYMLDNIALTKVYSITFVGGNEDVKGNAPVPFAPSSGEKSILPENTFTKDGYEFVGWKTENDKKIYKPDEEFFATSNVVFNPVFKKADLTIEFKSFVEKITLPEKISAKLNSQISFPTIDTKSANLTFVGFTDCENSKTPLSTDYIVTESKVLYALFKDSKGMISTKFDEDYDQNTIKINFDRLEITENFGSLTLSAVGADNVIWDFDSDKIVIEEKSGNTLKIKALKDGEATIVCSDKKNPKIVSSILVKISNQETKTAKREAKILLFGNSILKHPPLTSNNWFGNWGMAASSEDKDYAHRLCEYYIPKYYGEIDYKLGSQDFEGLLQPLGLFTADDLDYASAYATMMKQVKDYEADIIIFQVGDNVNQQAPTFNAKQYQNALEILIDETKKVNPNAVIMITSAYYARGFATVGSLDAAASRNVLFAKMDDLCIPENQGGNDGTGSSDEGGFTGGVRSHPGNRGMDIIAQRMFEQLDSVLSKYPLITVEVETDEEIDETAKDDDDGLDLDEDAISWSFTESTQGFESYNLFHFKAQNGSLQGTATDVKTTGATMKFISPKLNILPDEDNNSLVIRMKLSAVDTDTKLRVVLKTEKDSFEFEQPILNNEKNDYIFDISKITTPIVLMEIYPTNIDSSIEIYCIAFVNKEFANIFFEDTAVYKVGNLEDIKDSDWFFNDVISAYNLGFMNGVSETNFDPNGSVSLAQAITISVRINHAYTQTDTDFEAKEGEKWYTPYYNDAIALNIISADQFDNLDRAATRQEIILILHNSLTKDFFVKINDFEKIPDFSETETGFNSVLDFYQSGILSGSNEKREFKPDDDVKRSELCAIINRIAKFKNRIKF